MELRRRKYDRCHVFLMVGFALLSIIAVRLRITQFEKVEVRQLQPYAAESTKAAETFTESSDSLVHLVSYEKSTPLLWVSSYYLLVMLYVCYS